MEKFNVNSKIMDLKKLVEEEEKTIKESVELANKVKAKLDASRWKGESRNNCEKMLMLTQKYHDNILYLIESLKKHTSKLIQEIEEFPSDSINMKNLKE